MNRLRHELRLAFEDRWFLAGCVVLILCISFVAAMFTLYNEGTM